MTMFKPTTKTPHNPSRRATARVPDPIPVPTVCRHCGSPVALVNNSEIYGRPYGDWPWAYKCQGPDAECDAYVGLHPFTAIPLGTLANYPIRNARKVAKVAFHALWRDEGAPMSRTEAYAWLAERMGLTTAQCHFGLFDVTDCKKALEIIHGTSKR